LCAIPLPIVDSGHASSAGSSLCLTCGMCCRGVLNPTALLDEDELDRAAALGVRTLKKDDGHDAFHLPCPHHEHEANACTIYDSTCADVMSVTSCPRCPRTRSRSTRRCGSLGRRAPSKSASTNSSEAGTRARSSGIRQWRSEQSGIEDRVELATVHGEILVNLRMLSFLCNRHFEARLHKRLNVVPGGAGGS
jgi:hypothetical protein